MDFFLKGLYFVKIQTNFHCSLFPEFSIQILDSGMALFVNFKLWILNQLKKIFEFLDEGKLASPTKAVHPTGSYWVPAFNGSSSAWLMRPEAPAKPPRLWTRHSERVYARTHLVAARMLHVTRSGPTHRFVATHMCHALKCHPPALSSAQA
jgi:hypothetical protein